MSAEIPGQSPVMLGSSGVGDEAIASLILLLLASRPATASACPSEAARQLAPGNWRPLMPAIRRVAFDMARAGAIEITQSGRVIDAAELPKGPIRLRLPRR